MDPLSLEGDRPSVQDFRDEIIPLLYDKDRKWLLNNLQHKATKNCIILNRVVDSDVKFHCNCKQRTLLLVGDSPISGTLEESFKEKSGNHCIGCNGMYNEHSQFTPVGGLIHCVSSCSAFYEIRNQLLKEVPSVAPLFDEMSLTDLEVLLLPHSWSKQENFAIDHFCKRFHKISEIQAVCCDQPSLIPFLELEDEYLLNENVEGEVFDIDKRPENLIRARITKYDICNDSFEIDTDRLDVWDFNGVIKYWSQPNVLLNKHIQAGRATHVENPLELPRMSEIAKGTVFGTGIHGHTVEIKRGVQWLTCKIITHNADSAPTMSPNFHLAKFEHTDCWLDLRNLLQEDALRVTGASHVLGRLKECLGAFHSPSVSCEADARPG